MDIIVIKDLNFCYKEKKIFSHLDLNIKKGKWYTLVGENGCGKTTLVKILCGIIETTFIYVNGLEVINKNLFEIRKKMSVVFENPNTNLVCETVREELAFPIKNNGFFDIDDRIDKFLKMFDIESLADELVNNLSLKQKQLVAIVAALIIEPEIVIFDEAFTYLDDERKRIFSLIKSLKMTVINVTHEPNDLLFGDYISVLANGKIAINDEMRKVLDNEKIISSFGIKVPFIVDLSYKLKYYNLIDKVYIDYKDLVADLWK
ncbi:MAG: ABC transporter ATP-binding protein [Bacilli bacterium]|nr:ABC transporter ATP-binding protein [Bacilli bacterium]